MFNSKKTRFIAGENAPSPIEANEGYFVPNQLGNLAIKRGVLFEGVYLDEDRFELHFRDAPAILFPGSVLSGGIFLASNYQRRRSKVIANGIYTGPGSELEISPSDWIAENMIECSKYIH